MEIFLNVNMSYPKRIDYSINVCHSANLASQLEKVMDDFQKVQFGRPRYFDINWREEAEQVHHH